MAGVHGLAERGEDGAAVLRDLLGDQGADCVLECVGTKVSMEQAFASVRPGGRIRILTPSSRS